MRQSSEVCAWAPEGTVCAGEQFWDVKREEEET